MNIDVLKGTIMQFEGTGRFKDRNGNVIYCEGTCIDAGAGKFAGHSDRVEG
jgi:hypothetical protein